MQRGELIDLQVLLEAMIEVDDHEGKFVKVVQIRGGGAQSLS